MHKYLHICTASVWLAVLQIRTGCQLSDVFGVSATALCTLLQESRTTGRHQMAVCSLGLLHKIWPALAYLSQVELSLR